MSGTGFAVLTWTPKGGAPRRCRFAVECRIGRAVDNRIIVSDSGVSRRHARLTVGRNGLTLHNASALGSIQVDGRTLPPGQMTSVSPGERFRVGSQTFEVLAFEKPAPPPPTVCANTTCARTLPPDGFDCPWCGTSLAFADTQPG